MLVEENISIRKYNTFGLDYRASKIVHPESIPEIKSISKRLNEYQPYLIIGGGSNLLFTGDFDGTLIHPLIGGISIESSGSEAVTVSAGSGINWDMLVGWTVDHGFYGLENLSLIPGNVGASPVQNIGAYGTEVKDTIEKVETIRLSDGAEVSFNNADCGFAYRYSIFKGAEKGRYVVTRVHFRLSTQTRLNLDYGSVHDEVKRLGEATLPNVRQAVINIRRNKLPDPEITGNAGSFFKNPVVPTSFAESLRNEFPHIPLYPDKPGFTKIAAGWLIEQCGWKGKRDGDAGVHEKQSLVLVNYGNASGKEIFNLSEMIRASVKEKFNILLDREVEIAGSI